MDFAKLGLKAGVEVHAQLDTKHKLFCSCAARLCKADGSSVIERRMREVAGELGETDRAATTEVAKSKTFRYRLYPEESCLVEADEQIIHDVNAEALEKAIRIALMFGCRIPDEIHVMRKTILNGSVISGFQRTMCVGLEGHVMTKEGRIDIPVILLEEDSAQIIDRGNQTDTYGLDRLSMPLVEVGTSPQIKSAQQAREVALAIGLVLESSGCVRKGLGTIRQDVNVSIAGGVRTEIKGVQKLSWIEGLIVKEAERQKQAIAKGKQLAGEVRQAIEDGSTKHLRPIAGAARMYPETDSVPIVIDNDLTEKMKNKLPELLQERIARLRGYGLNDELARKIIEAGRDALFARLAKIHNAKTALNVLTAHMEQLSREGVDTASLSDERLTELFELIKKSEPPKEALLSILREMARNKNKSVKEIAQFDATPEDELRKAIRGLIESKREILERPNPAGAYMGMAMGMLKGKAAGSLVMKILNEEIAKAKK